MKATDKSAHSKDKNSSSSPDILSTFANTLRNLRMERDMTQHDLEDKSGLSLRMISDMERGVKQPTLMTLIKLAKGLDISVVELIGQFIKDRK